MITFKCEGKITIDPHDPKPTFIRELEPEAAMVKENRAIFRPTLWKSPNGIFMKVRSITITATGSWVLSVTEMYAEDAPRPKATMTREDPAHEIYFPVKSV